MTAQLTLKGLDAYVVYLEEEQARLHEQYMEHQEKTAAAKKTLAGMEEWQFPDSIQEHSILRHAHIKSEHLADCKTQRSALESIASMSNGIVRATEASELILEAG